MIESSDEEESDYDMEDGFIDDGGEGMDYSAHIKSIFGYDKSRLYTITILIINDFAIS